MKKSLGLKICASILVAPIFASFARGAFAADTPTYSIKVGGSELYSATEKKENIEETASFEAGTKEGTGTLTLNGYTGGSITTDLTDLTINVVKDSTITSTTKSIYSTGSALTIMGTGKLEVSNSIEVSGTFTQESGELTVKDNDIVSKGTIKINGKVTARSISLSAAAPTNSNSAATYGKILIGEKANVTVSKDITANYTTTATAKGIELTKVCASPAASIINIAGTGTIKTSTVFSADGSKAITGGLKIASSYCTEAGKSSSTTKDDTKNPDTLDAIYYYVAALVASSAILIYRRHLAKR